MSTEKESSAKVIGLPVAPVEITSAAPKTTKKARRTLHEYEKWEEEKLVRPNNPDRGQVIIAAGAVEFINVRLFSLAEMLCYRRRARSWSEEEFIERFLHPLNLTRDTYGNYMTRIAGDGEHIIWACHTDSVHRTTGYQKVYIDENLYIKLSKREKISGCLGADDASGVWLMCEMIKAQKPGTYIFHREEECGGLGSSDLVEKKLDILDGCRCVISLDRKGTKSVITHQGPRTCSDVFAESLGKAIGLGMAPDNTGTFTDSRHYTDVIGECTNISVGYLSQHTSHENQDMDFIDNLLDKLIALNPADLVYSRLPGEIEKSKVYTSTKRYTKYSGKGEFVESDEDNWWEKRDAERYAAYWENRRAGNEQEKNEVVSDGNVEKESVIGVEDGSDFIEDDKVVPFNSPISIEECQELLRKEGYQFDDDDDEEYYLRTHDEEGYAKGVDVLDDCDQMERMSELISIYPEISAQIMSYYGITLNCLIKELVDHDVHAKDIEEAIFVRILGV